MSKDVKLDHAGIGSILKSTEMHRLVQELTEQVAKNVESLGITVGDRDGGTHEYALPVKVEVTTTDRAHAIVMLAHPAGIAVQGKHGALTKAAAEAGLHVS